MSQKRVFNTNAEHIYVNDVSEYNLDLVNARSIDPAYSFTRNSAATYVGPDGLIKTAAVNQPRVEYDPVTGECKGLLVEESRINYQPYSQQVGGTSWSSTGHIVELNTQDTKDPSGNYSASKITDNGGSYITGVSGGINFSRFSIFAKAGNSSIFQIRSQNNSNWVVIDITTKTVTTITSPSYTSVKFIDYPNGWVRVLYTGATGGAYVFRLSTIGDYLYFWGAQAEIASSHSSYIPTTSSAVTRQPDQLVLNRSLNTQGTFFIESNPSQGISLVAGDASPTLSILQPTNQYTKSVLYYNNNRTLRMASDDSVPTEVNGLTPRIINKISLGYNSFNNISYINGYLKKFSYYSSPLSEDNLRALTGNSVPVSRATTAGNVFALGGTVTEITQNGLIYRVHTFTTVGTSELIIENGGLVEYLIVGGGGQGGSTGNNLGGGGGAGGLLTNVGSPVFVSTGLYSCIVGKGGSSEVPFTASQNGDSSSVFGLTAIGGGGGAGVSFAGSGGSGGGGGADGTNPSQGGAGVVGQGNKGANGIGGASVGGSGGGGGGAGAAGIDGNPNGANGLQSAITGTSIYYAGGGGGTTSSGTGGTGGLGGGGSGLAGGSGFSPGAPNTGGGGGATRRDPGGVGRPGSAGGSGIIVVRYPIGVA